MVPGRVLLGVPSPSDHVPAVEEWWPTYGPSDVALGLHAGPHVAAVYTLDMHSLLILRGHDIIVL